MEEQNNIIVNKENKSINISLIFTTVFFIICSIMLIIVDIIPHYDFATNKLADLISSVKFASIIISVGLILLFVVQLISKQDYKNINKVIKSILEYIVIIPIVIVIYTYIFTFALTFATVDGSSMYDTLTDGDEVVLFYNHEYDRNDIIVLEVNNKYYDYGYDKAFIKRVIGLPGDKIKIVRKSLLSNDVDLYINDKFIETYEESNSNLDIMRLDSDGYYLFFYYNDLGEKVYTNTIPSGYVFVMGDNRAFSNDSRKIGLVRNQDIIGVVKYKTVEGNMFDWEKLK